MKLLAVLAVLAGFVLAPVWGAPPAEACENCSCQGEGSGQMSQVLQALTGAGGNSQPAASVVKSDGPITAVNKRAQAVTRRLGASHLFRISMPVYWR